MADSTTSSPKRSKRTKKRKMIDIIIVILVIAIMVIVFGADLYRAWYCNKRLNTPVEPIFKVSDYGTTIRGTDNMVDHINTKVKEYLESSDSSVVSASIENGIWYIIQHRDNLFENDEIMENLMCYGWLLEYGSSDKIATEMGEQVAMVAKYMYRNQETLTSDYTQGKLKRINEYIEEILGRYDL